MTFAQIAFIGVGNMGLPMVRVLLAAGYPVRAFDVNENALQAAVSSGSYEAKSAIDAVEGADFVITMLPNTEHVLDLYLGQNDDAADADDDAADADDDAADADDDDAAGLLDVIREESVVLECSTISPQGSELLHDMAKDKGISLLDVPVSGGTASAAKGELTLMVGGDGDVLERASEVLSVLGARVFHAGGPGKGQIAKICNNMLLAVSMVGTAETLNLGVELGMDPKLLTEIIGASSGNNWSLSSYNPYPGVLEGSPASNNYEGGFSVALMLKDVGLAIEAAEASEQEVPMAEVARFLYERLTSSSKTSKKKDFSSIINLYLKSQ